MVQRVRLRVVRSVTREHAATPQQARQPLVARLVHHVVLTRHPVPIPTTRTHPRVTTVTRLPATTPAPSVAHVAAIAAAVAPSVARVVAPVAAVEVASDVTDKYKAHSSKF